MDRLPSVEEESEQRQLHGLFSCWGKLRLDSLWRRLRGCRIRRRHRRVCARRGSFKYDPPSYAQNFDEGRCEEVEEEGNYHCRPEATA